MQIKEKGRSWSSFLYFLKRKNTDTLRLSILKTIS